MKEAQCVIQKQVRRKIMNSGTIYHLNVLRNDIYRFFHGVSRISRKVVLISFEPANTFLFPKQDARGPAGYFPPQISSKKTTGQQICSLLTLFNIPIYEVCRKFDKKCIKTLKIGKFWVFCHFRFQLIYFSFRKQPLSLRKSILDNEFLPFLSR